MLDCNCAMSLLCLSRTCVAFSVNQLESRQGRLSGATCGSTELHSPQTCTCPLHVAAKLNQKCKPQPPVPGPAMSGGRTRSASRARMPTHLLTPAGTSSSMVGTACITSAPAPATAACARNGDLVPNPTLNLKVCHLPGCAAQHCLQGGTPACWTSCTHTFQRCTSLRACAGRLAIYFQILLACIA